MISEGLTLDSQQRSITDLPFVEVLSLPKLSSAEFLQRVLERLATLGCNDVLIEAGSKLAGSFVEAGLWDELVIYMAPKLLGSSARALLDLPIDKMLNAKSVSLIDLRLFGDDIRFIYHPAKLCSKA